MSKPQPIHPRPRRGRLSISRYCVLAAGLSAAVALAVLVAEVFRPMIWLQAASLWLIGLAALLLCIAVYAWRIPVFGPRAIAFFAAAWVGGIALSVVLVLLSQHLPYPPAWRWSVQWVAVTLSFAVGTLLLRSLLRVRSSSIAIRCLSLISPLGVLLLIILTYRTA